MLNKRWIVLVCIFYFALDGIQPQRHKLRCLLSRWRSPCVLLWQKGEREQRFLLTRRYRMWRVMMKSEASPVPRTCSCSKPWPHSHGLVYCAPDPFCPDYFPWACIVVFQVLSRLFVVVLICCKLKTRMRALVFASYGLEYRKEKVEGVLSILHGSDSAGNTTFIFM